MKTLKIEKQKKQSSAKSIDRLIRRITLFVLFSLSLTLFNSCVAYVGHDHGHEHHDHDHH